MLLLLFCLPTMAIAAISVDVTAGDSEAHAAVTAAGEQKDIISDKEIESFEIKGNQLKSAVEKYFGESPTEAYLKKPGGPERLYDTYGWYEVQRVLVPYESRVLKVKSKPLIVAKQRFTNHSNRNASYDAAISQKLKNTVSTSWSNSQKITVSNEISVKVNFKTVEFGGSVSYGFGASWGKKKNESQEITVGSTTGVTVELEAGEIVEAQLTCTRGTQEVEVEYVGYLTGDVAVNYKNSYKGHHYHALDIFDIQYKAGLPVEITVKQILDIGYYFNAEVIIKDIQTKDTKADQFVDIKNIQ